MDNESQKIVEINNKLKKAKLSFQEACRKLSAKRMKASRKLENDINKELKPLKLIDANFKVEILARDEEDWNKNGSELVRFLVRLR